MSKANSLSLSEFLADDVGLGFSLGTVGGFGYHLVKGFQNNKYDSALRLACQKVSRVGGKGALLLLASSTMLIADVSIRDKDDLYSPFISYGFAGAAVNAKRGFRSASLSAPCFGTTATICYASLDYMPLMALKDKEKEKAHFSPTLSLHH